MIIIDSRGNVHHLPDHGDTPTCIVSCVALGIRSRPVGETTKQNHLLAFNLFIKHNDVQSTFTCMQRGYLQNTREVLNISQVYPARLRKSKITMPSDCYEMSAIQILSSRDREI